MDIVPEVARDSGRNLGREDLEEAAVLRFCVGLSWDHVAERLGTTRRTLYNHRQTEQWREIAKACLEDMRAEGMESAWGCLIRGAQSGKVDAAKEILDRIEGKVTQPLAHGQDPNADPAKLEHLGLERLMEIARNGNGRDVEADPGAGESGD